MIYKGTDSKGKVLRRVETSDLLPNFVFTTLQFVLSMKIEELTSFIASSAAGEGLYVII